MPGDEWDAISLNYTSGTTGNPKGVVYSHRSSVLHSMGITSGATLGISERDRVLAIVPMFHANAWGLPYAGWFVGTDFVFPDRFLQAEPLCKIIERERPTVSGAVPTIWNEVLRYAEKQPVDFSSFRLVICGGSVSSLRSWSAGTRRRARTSGSGVTRTSELSMRRMRRTSTRSSCARGVWRSTMNHNTTLMNSAAPLYGRFSVNNERKDRGSAARNAE